MSRRGAGNVVQKANAREHEQAIWQYKLEGKSHRKIAELLGMSLGGVSEAFNRVMNDVKEHNRALAEVGRDLELARLDELWEAVYDKVIHHRYLPGIDTLLKIHAARVKLLGIAAPLKVAQTDVDGNAVAKLDTGELLRQLPEALRLLRPEAQAAVAGLEEDDDQS